MDRNQFKLLRQIPQKQNVMYFCTLQLYMNRGDRYEHSRTYFLQRVRVVSTQNFFPFCLVYAPPVVECKTQNPLT